ncbi:survival of motor neuron-related-splicing factor 30 [Planococcus citri]|uniref:survival of motor neuron-related-splicing factor 30 n=1 Tax=Planococcus citri TaxID=170843 RepID=UPI0031FA0B9C
MAEDLQNYKLQLEQVEAALTTAPDNEELLTLKKDLEQVIELTTQFIKSQLPDEKRDEIDLFTEDVKVPDSSILPSEKLKKNWRIGERCLAFWLDDGQYYEATVESIENDEVSVLFDSHKVGVPVVLTKEFLKELPKGQDRGLSKLKKLPTTKEREYLKKKKLKKQQRFKQMEEERETEKNKWLMFSSKTYKKGITKKSIFASPDNVNGRVGIGTCGVAGRGMTDFQHAEKHKK